MSAIEIDGISKRYDDVVALHEIGFSVEPGEFITLLGPSGCGKTTTLRSIAGLERPDTGRIAIDGREMFPAAGRLFVPPEQRGLGMVFQSYAIWPHMTVFQNVAYGLVAKKIPSPEIAKRVNATLESVGLGGYGDRPATHLSGGQQQRVALARSLVGEPSVLLLDEPLSNLDSKLRERMRLELKQLQKQHGLTTVYVTHDQAEALALSDRIVVMDGGRIVQQGRGRDIYRNPQSRFVVDFVGHANLIEGTILTHDLAAGHAELQSASGFVVRGEVSGAITVGGTAIAALRPEDIRLERHETNNWQATIVSDLFLGNMRELLLDVGGHVLKAQVAREQAVPEDGKIWFSVSPDAIRIVP
jgi:iron(III) transport system ATP-binding protein